MLKQNKQGFTLIELLVVIAIIGFLLSAATYAYQIARMKSRDAIRANDVRVLQSALANYLNDFSSYPVSTGECLVSDNSAGKLLLDNRNLRQVPQDPIWPNTAPASINNGQASGSSRNFCYYYSSDGSIYYLSYYLEANSNAGDQGINIISAEK